MDYSNDILIKFFIDNNLTDEIVNDNITTINNMDIQFKELFELLDKEYNIINKLIDKLKQKETELLNQLEQAEQNKNETMIDEINNSLNEILEYDSYIYKINNGYVQYDYARILEIINSL
jgi:hypothetical protein